MPKFKTVKSITYLPRQMFDLVADVEKYPEFLPLCEALTIRSRRALDSRELLLADMTVGYKAIRETFTSKVLLKPDDLEIDVQYVDGPFRYLTNLWQFADDGEDGTNIEFDIDYEFKSRMLGLVMGSMFERAFRTFSDAFEARAHKVYGKPLA